MSAQKTAEKITKAIEKRQRRLVTAPAIVRFMLAGLPLLWPKLVDCLVQGKDARKP